MQTKSVLTEQKNQPGWSIFLPYANWFKIGCFSSISKKVENTRENP